MSPLRIALDVKPLTGQRTGVGRVLEGLLGGLEALAPSDLELRRLAPSGAARTLPWVHFGLPRRVRRGEVLHCPFYYRPVLVRVPTVVTIHDALVLSHPEWFTARGRHPFGDLLRWSARHAAAVVTPSQAVIDELERLVGPMGERARAVPHGVDAELFNPRAADPEALRRHGIYEPYLLHLGSLQPRRGLGTALAALELLAPGHPDLDLVLVGKTEASWGAVPERLRPRVRQTGYLRDGDLPALLAGAAVMLSLSHGEGFDLPLLEALACGTTVIASDIDVHREHFAEWAHLVPVGDAAAVAAIVGDVLRRPPSARAREAQAEAVHRRFTWEATAEAHLEVWRSVARGRAF